MYALTAARTARRVATRRSLGPLVSLIAWRVAMASLMATVVSAPLAVRLSDGVRVRPAQVAASSAASVSPHLADVVATLTSWSGMSGAVGRWAPVMLFAATGVCAFGSRHPGRLLRRVAVRAFIVAAGACGVALTATWWGRRQMSPAGRTTAGMLEQFVPALTHAAAVCAVCGVVLLVVADWVIVPLKRLSEQVVRKAAGSR
jgi:hypothetical protein